MSARRARPRARVFNPSLWPPALAIGLAGALATLAMLATVRS